MPNHQPKKTSPVFTGIISVTKSGRGFVAHEDLEEDIIIYPEELNTALNGDEVEVQIMHKGAQRAKGRITRILTRARTDFVCTITSKGSQYIGTPADQRMYAPLRINEIGDAKEGDKALVKLTSWKNAHVPPEGSVTRVLGKAGLHETEMHAALATHGFISEFPPEVEAEAALLAESFSKELAHEATVRRDFRAVPTFTIDPDDAKDFDDALSVQTLNDGTTEVGVHIADVSHYVRPGSLLDEEARARSTSVYLVDRTIPMLPEILSNNICSLVPDEERLTFSAVFTMRGGEVVDRWFGRTIIRSDKRFTYRTAQDILDRKASQDTPLTKEVETLADIARALRKKRDHEGAIGFETDEVKFELAEDGTPVKVFVKEKLETMKVIEEWMLLANREVATWVTEHVKDKRAHEQTFIYRIHDAPAEDRLEELRIFLKAIGYDLGSNKPTHQITPKDIDTLLRETRGTPEEAMVQMATLRSMAKAVYTHKNIGHFSLGFNNYTHFTSPIRRYPDVIVHRILASHLKGGTTIQKDEMLTYQKLAISSSAREVAAVEAERDSVKYKQVEYMQGKVGQTFRATVTGVAEHGMYVAEEYSRAEGLIHISTLADDFYTLDQKTRSLVGERNGRAFRLGDVLDVKLLNADREKRQLDWALA